MNTLPGIFAALKNSFRWFRALGGWLGEPRLLWFTAFALAAAIIGAFWIGSERAFRLIGLALQLVGIATVAWNIRGTRTLFARPGFLTLVAQWLHRRPKFNPPPITAVMSATQAAQILSGRAEVWHNAESGATLHVRTDAIEKNLSRLRDRLNDFEREVRKDLRQHADALERESLVRANHDNAIDEKLEVAQVGGLHISAAGVAWLVLGVIMSTASVEWALFAKALFP